MPGNGEEAPPGAPSHPSTSTLSTKKDPPQGIKVVGYGSRLFDQHQDKLASSAISVEVANERGYVTADTKAQLERYGFSPAQRRPPALIVPLHDVFGQPAGYQVRPDEPRVLNGRTMKYESRLGQKMVLDVPPRVHPHLGDPSRPLIVTEGPLKADSLVTAGFDAVDLLGVWSWRGTNDEGGKVALAAWEQVALEGRQVYIAFDSDVMLKPQVHEAMSRFASFLRLRGAEVAYVYLSSEAGAKVGADDFLAAGHTAADLIALATSELRKLPGAAEPEPVDTFDDVPDEPGWQVLNDVVAILDRYVAWPTVESRDAVALWIAHTYLLDVFDITPRLALLSPEKQCGKSTVLELTEFLARRARVTVSMSPAYMYRAIDEYRPTLLIDEVDTVFGGKVKSDSNEALRGLINAGYRDGATVGRMVGEGAAQTPTDFDVFSPVALAGIGNCLPDTVLDRSVIVQMRRRGPGEPVEDLRRRRVRTQAAPLSRRIAAWTARTAETLDGVEPAMPKGITDRPADTWEPLLVIADAAGGNWPERSRLACIKLNAVRADNDGSLGVKLLADIRDVFGPRDQIDTATLMTGLCDVDESPWGDWLDGKSDKARGSWLARRLKPFGIAPTKIRIGESTARGYHRPDFEDVWSRYLPATPQEDGTNGTNGTSQVAPTRDVPSVPSVPFSEGGNGQHADPPAIDVVCSDCGHEDRIEAWLLNHPTNDRHRRCWQPECSGQLQPAFNPGELGPLPGDRW